MPIGNALRQHVNTWVGAMLDSRVVLLQNILCFMYPTALGAGGLVGSASDSSHKLLPQVMLLNTDKCVPQTSLAALGSGYIYYPGTNK